MSSHTINVSGIAPSTSKEQLQDFFTFCGKITSIDYSEKNHTATIAFEKPNSARTALMLHGGSLDGANLNITSDAVHAEDPVTQEHPIDQSDKPRAGIAAEYLSKGYMLSDNILQRAIEMDNKQGISKRFLNYFQSLDKTLGARALGPDKTLSAKVQTTVDQASQQAKTLDEQKGFSKTAHDYYLKAIASPLGQQVRTFYTDTSKQVKDIHEEARRIVDQEKLNATTSTSSQANVPAPAPEPKA